MSTGESPFECAKREALEEVGIDLADQDLNLFGYVSEKNYEGKNHWLMFLFEVIPLLGTVPRPINEGCFKFFLGLKLIFFKSPKQITSLFGHSTIKEDQVFGVFEQTSMPKLLKL